MQWEVWSHDIQSIVEYGLGIQVEELLHRNSPSRGPKHDSRGKKNRGAEESHFKASSFQMVTDEASSSQQY